MKTGLKPQEINRGRLHIDQRSAKSYVVVDSKNCYVAGPFATRRNARSRLDRITFLEQAKKARGE